MTTRHQSTTPGKQSTYQPDPHTIQTMQRRMLDWFAAHARDLPWRHTRNPYSILVAEMMLQQTQVDRVLPRYHAFLEEYPTLDDLAAAPSADIIRQWAGLGYNRRAINLQRIARTIRDQHSGSFPRQVEQLRQLPGIGPYTAGAIACFAFEQDVAFMDTNIRRVLRRVLLGPEDTAPALPDRALLEQGQSLIPPGQGWAWNQGLMELGALVCTAARPLCWRCPLREHCRAYATWRQADETLFVDEQQPSTPDAPAVYPATRSSRPARRVAERAAQPFVGSQRYYRGKLVAQLRALPPGEQVALEHLGPQIKDDFSPDADLDWLRNLVAGLVRDGLAEMTDNHVSLPAT
jgi:A/G-specific adenine glycosylase